MAETKRDGDAGTGDELSKGLKEPNMDDIARGIATASLTLQSVMLQALVAKGLLTRAEAIEIVDKSLDAVVATPDDEGAVAVAEVAPLDQAT